MNLIQVHKTKHVIFIFYFQLVEFYRLHLNMKKGQIPLEHLESRDETNELNNNSEYQKYQCKMHQCKNLINFTKTKFGN